MLITKGQQARLYLGVGRGEQEEPFPNVWLCTLSSPLASLYWKLCFKYKMDANCLSYLSPTSNSESWFTTKLVTCAEPNQSSQPSRESSSDWEGWSHVTCIVCSEEALRRAGWVTQHEYSLWLLPRAVPAPAASPTFLTSVHRIQGTLLPSPVPISHVKNLHWLSEGWRLNFSPATSILSEGHGRQETVHYWVGLCQLLESGTNRTADSHGFKELVV